MARSCLLSLLIFYCCAIHIFQAAVTNVAIKPAGFLWALVDRPFELACTAEGWKAEEDRKPEWRKDAALITAETHPTFVITNEVHDTYIKSTLRTESAGMHDSGDFMCSAGRFDDSVHVAAFSVVYKDVNITVGFETLLEIDIKTNYQQLMTTWSKDGVPLLEVDDLENRITIALDNRSVSIDDTKASDGGIYTAKIEFNPGRFDTQSFEINITALGPPNIKDAENSEKLQTVDNTSIALECPARGQPPPKVVWFKGKEILEPTERLTFSELDGVENGLLEITETTALDLGEYTCSAENYRGKASVVFVVKDPYAGNAAGRLKEACWLTALLLFIAIHGSQQRALS